MSLLSDPPFALGQTLGVTSATEGGNWVGCIKHFPDVDPTTGQVRSNRLKTCVAVRNTSGAALLPKRVAKFDTTTAGKAVFTEVKGYAAVTNEEFVGVVDEFLRCWWLCCQRRVLGDGFGTDRGLGGSLGHGRGGW
jgi:hypothetical protein